MKVYSFLLESKDNFSQLVKYFKAKTYEGAYKQMRDKFPENKYNVISVRHPDGHVEDLKK